VRSARLLTPLDLSKGIFLFLSVCATVGYRASSLRSLGHVLARLRMYQITIHSAEQISEANRKRKKQVNDTKWHQYGCNSKNNKSLAKGDKAKVSIAKIIV
jgi:hypothetical protein